MKTKKRKVDLVVISDIHLGTYGCHAKETLRYLKGIEPGHLILNGDIIDIWQFSKRYWPKSHMKVIKHLMSLVGKGVKVTYVTGNHDEMLRKFTGFELGSLEIVNKTTVKLDDGEAWIFHGDVFDVTMQHSKWLAKLGGKGYDLLILINRGVNFLLQKLGRSRISISKRVKEGVKSAVSFINDFETLVADLASENGYKYVVCGHIHQPVIKMIKASHGDVMYLNSGDWVENLTALEYHNGKWQLYTHQEELEPAEEPELELDYSNKVLFENMLAEFKMVAT